MTSDPIDTEACLDIQISVSNGVQVNKYPAKQHAQRVAAKLGVTEGLIYLPGQATVMLEDSDQAIPFRQLRYFYYLTGVDEPDCYVTYDIGADLLTLYITVLPPLQQIWLGAGLSIKDAESLYDADAVKSAEDLFFDLTSWIADHAGTTVYLLHDAQKPKLDFSVTADPFNDGPLQYAMDSCRVIKDQFELDLLRKANEIATIAHTEVLRNIRSFDNERQVQAIFEEACTSRGVKTQSYNVIAGSGPNASCLHYMKNDEPFGDRQFLLIDAGPDWHCYASDVTRTFPISGHWPSKEAKQIYDIVDEMQTAVIDRLKPGVRYRDMGDLATEIMVKGLKKIGVFKNYPVDEIIKSGAARIFFPHGLGHHVGLEVHDVSPLPITGLSQQPVDQYLRGFKAVPPPHIMDAVLLEKNMLITVEPGCYFSQIALDQLVTKELEKYIDLAVAKKYVPIGGVRIEDDILITKDGHESYTTAPKGEHALKIIRGEA